MGQLETLCSDLLSKCCSTRLESARESTLESVVEMLLKPTRKSPLKIRLRNATREFAIETRSRICHQESLLVNPPSTIRRYFAHESVDVNPLSRIPACESAVENPLWRISTGEPKKSV